MKSTRPIRVDEVIGEYVGRVRLESEPNNSSSASLVVYRLDSAPIASSSSTPGSSTMPSSSSSSSTTSEPSVVIEAIGGSNQLRHMRKSCRPNVRLRHAVDAQGNIRFEVVAAEDVAKCVELTLPLNDVTVDLSNPTRLVCLCNGSNHSCSIAKLNGTDTKAMKTPIKYVLFYILPTLKSNN